MKKLITTITALSLLASLYGYSQGTVRDTSAGNKKNQIKSREDFMSSWTYFNLADTIELKIIHHAPATMDCSDGVKTFAITIGTTQSGDTIRVLELCDRTKSLNTGDIVSVIPAKTPKEYYTHPGVFVQAYPGPLKPQNYDARILKTTYGTLEPK